MKRLLTSREDIFPSYNIDGFETAIGEAGWNVVKKHEIEGTCRRLYLLGRAS